MNHGPFDIFFLLENPKRDGIYYPYDDMAAILTNIRFDSLVHGGRKMPPYKIIVCGSAILVDTNGGPCDNALHFGYYRENHSRTRLEYDVMCSKKVEEIKIEVNGSVIWSSWSQ